MITERVGLLLVHGIGDQNRNEHLQAVSTNLVKLLSWRYGKQNVSVEMFPGLDRKADLSILVRPPHERAPKTICIDVHECWWRDLGEPPTVYNVVKFWLWAASFFGTKGRFCKPGPVMRSPSNFCTDHGWITPLERALLFARVTYFFVMLFPLRLLTQFVNIIPGIRPTNLFRTIFHYMSSIQIYSQRRGKIGGTLVDFDQSRRISIQRRMANALITMAERRYDRWYIMGHSLGSVIALKGLMYPDDAFARFMTLNRWNETNASNKTVGLDAEYPDRPKCPHWLAPGDGIHAAKVLERCRGFISLGSPLEMFAQIWPEMVQLNRTPALPAAFEWINLYDPIDIVTSELSSYRHELAPATPDNFACRSSWLIFWAHTSYLNSRGPRTDRMPGPAIITWMLHPESSFREAAAKCGLQELSVAQRMSRTYLALLQWLTIFLVGMIAWPISTLVFVKAIGGIPRLLFNFGGYNAVADAYSRTVEAPIEKWLSNQFFTANVCEDIGHFLNILTIIGGVLLVAGAIHHAIDRLLEYWARKDRITGNRRITSAAEFDR